MQVGLVAVAGTDHRDALVGGVVDDVLALAEPGLEDPSLPPRQDGLAFVLLDLEVGRLVVRGNRVKPDQVAGLVDDHRSRRTIALVGRQQEVARRGARHAQAW